MSEFQSWGHFKPNHPQQAVLLPWGKESRLLAQQSKSVLPYGQGRSYGDSCLNSEGALLVTHDMDHILAFDPNTGVMICEAGIRMDQIHNVIVKKGWFLPVVPGTESVSIGGAIANDIHGKNHHNSGSFGQHVLRLNLLRSNGQIFECSRQENADLFYATIGGLGLTGLILSTEIQMQKIESSYIRCETVKFKNLDEFLEIDQESISLFEYTVAWVDTFAKGKAFGRGLYHRGNHLSGTDTNKKANAKTYKENAWSIPNWLEKKNWLSPFALRIFNSLLYYRQFSKIVTKKCFYKKFFFPLDGLKNWNHFYGESGLMQYQCVLPKESARQNLPVILKQVQESVGGSYLCVLKSFGDRASQGMLSFARPGVTLAMDFPLNSRTRQLCADLNAFVTDCGGRIYLAKDGQLSAEHFQKMYPEWENFKRYVDPQFSSDQWRRLCPQR